MGGNLASIHSAKEQSFLRSYMNRVSFGYRLTWIGGHDGVKEGFWMWADGSRFDYQAWATNQPDNKKNQDCLEMNYAGNFWNDARCTLLRPYICSKDLPCCDDHRRLH
ncbi:Galactose-specific lectin nattectin [Trichinella nelsoni]|uniref:Galactose-specific lectin nattectin n=1 Tax=Trichinella nelsoni TaxID=6336 RepID=A0A0V0RCT1_9BILA|nr:Galactose-specific lectin nattectin [Trichinella nelsoni]